MANSSSFISSNILNNLRENYIKQKNEMNQLRMKMKQQESELHQKEYNIKEFRRILEKHESSKIWGARMITAGPSSIR